MLSTPDETKHLRWKVDDDDAEDITDQVKTTYTAARAMHEIIADISEEGITPQCNMVHMIGTRSEARGWTDKDVNIDLINSEGYPFPQQQQQCQEEETGNSPTTDDETRWTYYHRPVGESPPQNDEGIISGSDMERLGDNDPFVMAMKDSGILSNQHNHHLNTIEEGGAPVLPIH